MTPEQQDMIIDISMPDDAKGDLTLVISNGDYRITIKQDANGKNNIFTIPALLEGKYTISATFSSIKYVTNSSVVNVNVIHKPVYKVTANDVVMDYKDGSKYKILVTKDGKAVGTGQVVKITFNGKTINVKTDKNGYAKLKLTQKPGLYQVMAKYKDFEVANVVQIKQVIKSMTSFSGKKLKSTFKYKVKFLGKNKKNKKITVKFNKKTYKAKTNKKGIAKFTIKTPKKPGSYNLVTSYKKAKISATFIRYYA